MKSKSLMPMLGLATAGAAAAAAYTLWFRPRHLRWGATDEEINEALPGDDVMPDAGIQVTHAITIDAPPEEVWRWLVQIGQGRGGFYSYDYLENMFGLGIHNTDKIHPELQGLKKGDFIRSADPDFACGKYLDKAGWFVIGLEKERFLVLRDEIEHGSWSFVLKPQGDRTRLIVRARGNKPQSAGTKLFYFGFWEPAHFIMERKMLLTIKALAETRGKRESVFVPDEAGFIGERAA